MAHSDSDIGKIELEVRSALLEGGYPQQTATNEGFMVTRHFPDLFRAGEGVVEIAHAPCEQATREQISAYRTALENHQVNKDLRFHVVAVGPKNEYRLYASRLWHDDEVTGDTNLDVEMLPNAVREPVIFGF